MWRAWHTDTTYIRTSSPQHSLSAFKAVYLFSPQKLQVMELDVNVIDGLSIFPFLNSTSILDGLKAELPTYLAKSVDIDSNFSCLEWWKQNETVLPCFSAAACKIFLISCIGMCFFIAKRIIQHHSHQDYVKLWLCYSISMCTFWSVVIVCMM